METQLSYPIYLLPLIAVTLVFLFLSSAFMARLLDAIGRPVSATQLAEMAIWGWSLTGFALTLLVCGSLILPRGWRDGHSARTIATAVVISMIICCETVDLFGPALTNCMEDWATAANRQCAVYLRALASVKQDDVSAPTPIGIRMAMLKMPITGLSCAHVPGASADGLIAAVHRLAARRLGGPEQIYDATFIPSVRSLRDTYNEYAAAQLRLVNDIQSIPAEGQQAWQDYLEHLQQTGISPSHIRRDDWARIVAETRARGIPVPTDWNPTDGVTFRAEVAASLRQAADARYSDFVIRHFQQSIPPGLDWESFYKEPIIQDRWRATIGAPGAATLAPNMGFEVFRAVVYQPQLDRLVQTQLANLLGSAKASVPRSQFAPAGDPATAWVMVPTVLFYVTMVCILWHAGQLLHFGGHLLFSGGPARKHLALGLFLGFAALLIATLVPLSRQDEIGTKPRQQTADEMPFSLRLFWSIGSGLRNTVFMGFGFGYDPIIGNEGKEEPLAQQLHPTQLTP